MRPVHAPALVVVALGDSTTAGTPFWQSPVEAPPDGRGDATAPWTHHVSGRHPGATVHNRGVNGERTDQILARFDRDVLAAQPDIVVVIAGVNDIYQGRSAETVTATLAAIYARATAAGIRVVAGSIVPYNTASADQNARMHAANDWIRAEAARNPNVSFVDTRAAAAAPDDIDRLSGSPDGLHPDKDGYRRMGQAVDHVLSTMLKKTT